MRLRRVGLWAVLVVFIIAGYGILGKLPESLSDEFGGSYSCEDDVFPAIMAIDPHDGNSFYYTDSENKHYIRGHFVEKDEDIYSISCDSAANKVILPDQDIILGNQSFKLTVSGQQLTFKKVHQAPILYGDDDIYK